MADALHLYDELVTRYKEYAVLSSVTGVLHWDMQVMMSPKGAERRANQMALLSGIMHDRLTAPRIGELVERLSVSPNGLSDAQQANLREIGRDYRLATKVPKELVEEMSRQQSVSHEVWAKAREVGDFPMFAPHLEKLVALSKQKAEYLGYVDTPYDAMLDLYEPGGTTAFFTTLFDQVKAANVPLVKRIVDSPVKADRRFLSNEYDPELQKQFGRDVMKQLGFDAKGGRLDTSIHPFCSGAKGDIRITTRYNPRAPQQALFGIIHETGHALYEQEVSAEHLDTPLSEALSMGMHESQSRMWENLVGRGKPFWTYFYPRLQSYFPQQTEGVSMEQFVLAINHVERSLVRVEADEMTYDLHIILRFEIERDLFAGKVSVSDLPRVWNRKIEEYLGLTPKNDGKEGVMQDVHWCEAYFGYFPSYSLGNFAAAQFWGAMRRELPQLDQKMERGEFGDILAWLREKVHLHGRRFGRDELMTRATGKALDTADYVQYLRNKYSELYRLS
ncbi:carboxypeptidase M32 [candidate division KSB1 bacterium]|nr:carboxypeptidase M32 [candidate division KSB1 bacterium]